MAKQPILAMINKTAGDFNPPLYYLILHYWMKIFGGGEVSLRGLSLIFFAANIFVILLFLQNILKVKGRRIWIYILLFSLNPFLLYFAFEARMYSLLALLSTLSFYFFWQKKAGFYHLVTILGLYTHYFFLFVVATHFAFGLLFKKGKLVKKIKLPTLSFIFFLPWLLYVFPHLLTNTARFWLGKSSFYDLITLPAVLFTGYERSYFKFWHAWLLPLSIFFILTFVIFVFRRVRLIKGRTDQSRLFLLLVFWSFLFPALSVLVSFLKPVFLPRYLIFASAGFNLLLFFVLEKESRRLRLLSILILFFIIAHFTHFEVLHRRKGDIRRTILEIKKLATAEDFLFVSKAEDYFVAAYYFSQERVYVLEEKGEEVPYYTGLVLIPENKITTKLPVYPERAFVLKNDREFEVRATLP